MSDRWKDIFIIITLGILAILSMITIVELFLVKTLNLDGNTTVSFIGAILGGLLSGYITLLGVNKTLKHRDREVFLNNYSEKLMQMDVFEETYSKYVNSIYFIENSDLYEEEKRGKIQNVIKSLYEQLTIDREKIYKVMDYNDSIEILNLYKKSLRQYINKNTLSKQDADACVGKIRDIFQIFNVSKKHLEKKYREFRKEV